ncbi:MAG: helix-turn-helix transcriptional regulator [Dehalococcoidia bacterium]
MGRARQVGIEITDRQREVLNLLAKGHSNGEIAEALGISLPGAKWHVRELMDRVGVESRDELAEWWERERSVGARLGRTVRALLGAGLGKVGAAAAAGTVIFAASAVVVGFAALGSGSASDESEEVTPTLSRGEAESRARMQLQGHLESIGFDGQYSTNGHAVGAEDFATERAEFYPEATHLPSLQPGGTPTLFAQPGIDVWLFTFSVNGLDEPATGGEFNASVTVRDDLPDTGGAYIWGNQSPVHGREGPQKLSEPEVLAKVEDGDRQFEVAAWRSVNGWCQSVEWTGGVGLSGRCGMATRPLAPGQWLEVAGILNSEDGSYVEALVAVVTIEVSLVRFTAVDGSITELEPLADPALPLAAVALRPPTNRGVVLVEALGEDGIVLATHGTPPAVDTAPVLR